MAKNVKTTPITGADLEEFLKGDSDFGFELAAIPLLVSKGFKVEHGGLYTDPITRQNRQFDLRAEKSWNPIRFVGREPTFSHTLRLAIECKNLKPHFPLLISCVPRTASECYTGIVLSDENGRSTTGKLSDGGTEYSRRGPVGRATDQVGRLTGGELTSNDSEVYDKWSQAINSSADLVSRAEAEKPRDGRAVHCTSIYPVLLVPDGTLWECRYENGSLVETPKSTNRCEFYIGKEWPIRGKGDPFVISHMEILTLSGLRDWLPKVSEIETLSLYNDACENAASEWLESAVPTIKEVHIG